MDREKCYGVPIWQERLRYGLGTTCAGTQQRVIR